MAAEHSVAAARWRPSARAAWTRLGTGAAVVMDTRADHPHVLDPVGSVVWEVLLRGLTPEDDLAGAAPRSVREVATEVAAEFDAPAETVLPGVLDFLDRLARLGVVERA